MTQSHPKINLASFPNPDNITRRTFGNGAVALGYKNPSSPSVVVHGWLWTGSIDVPPEKAGLASLTASLLTRGTQRRTFAQIGQEIESVGAAMSIGASGHTTRFTIKCLVEDLALLLDILTDCLYHPTFPQEYVERRQGQILTAIEQRENSTRAMASLAFNKMLYPNHPYGVSQLGTKETISSLTRKDIETFYQTHYGSSQMGMTVVGALSPEAGLDAMEEAFGKWSSAPHTPPILPKVSPPTQIQQSFVSMPGKTQSDIFIGWLAMKRTSPDYTKAFLANCILGEFGLMGRIGEQIRQTQGLAYYAYTHLEAGLGPGPWAASIGVDPENTDRAIEAVLEQIERLRNEPVDEDELGDNKSYILGSLPLRLEGNEGIAAHIVEMELYELGLDYIQRLPALISVLTAQDVMDIAQTYLDPKAYICAIAGPENESFIKT